MPTSESTSEVFNSQDITCVFKIHCEDFSLGHYLMMIVRVCLSKKKTEVSSHLETQSEHKIHLHVNLLYYVKLREGGWTAVCCVPWDYPQMWGNGLCIEWLLLTTLLLLSPMIARALISVKKGCLGLDVIWKEEEQMYLSLFPLTLACWFSFYWCKIKLVSESCIKGT